MNEMQVLGRIQEELRSQNESNNRLAKLYETLSELEGDVIELKKSRQLATLIISEWISNPNLTKFTESGGEIRIKDKINGNVKETNVTLKSIL